MPPCTLAVSRHLAPLLTCSLGVQEIQHHPWFVEGLNPAALAYNDSILQLSLESQPPQEVIEEVRALRVDWLGGKGGMACGASGLAGWQRGHSIWCQRAHEVLPSGCG